MKNFRLIFTALFALMFVFQSCQKEDVIEKSEKFTGTRSYEDPEAVACGSCPEGGVCSNCGWGGGIPPVIIKDNYTYNSYDQAVRVVVSWKKVNNNDPIVTGLQVYPISDFLGYLFSIVDYYYTAELINNGNGFRIILYGERLYHYEFKPGEERPVNEFIVPFSFPISIP